MKYEIEYHEVPHGAPIFSFPEYVKTEFKEFDSINSALIYVSQQKDSSGSFYDAEGGHGYVLTSRLGGVRIKECFEPASVSPSVPEQMMGFNIPLEEMARQELINEVKRLQTENRKLKTELAVVSNNFDSYRAFGAGMGYQGGA